MYNFTVLYTCRYIYLFIFFIIINCDMSHVLEINYLILSYLIYKTFSYFGAHIWNHISNNISTNVSYSSFKHLLKFYIQNNSHVIYRLNI